VSISPSPFASEKYRAGEHEGVAEGVKLGVEVADGNRAAFAMPHETNTNENNRSIFLLVYTIYI
jgi:hypothetical protein